MVTYIFNGECSSGIKHAFIDTYLQKLELVVETTADYKKSGIYSAERNYASMPIVIDWGDGTVEQVNGDISQKVHTYATVGTFNVVVKNIKSYAASTNNITWCNTTSQNAFTLKEIVVMPNSVTSIGNNAFDSCNRLTSVTIPDSVTSIGDRAFITCSSLTGVVISDSVMSIGQYAFCNCSELMSFTVGNGNVNYKSVNGLLLSKDGKTLIAGVNGDVIIPNSVTSIWVMAFRYCSGLTSVTIPNSVTSIQSETFYACSGLTNVTIPDSVTSIGSSAFLGCNSLTSVTIGNGVTSIISSAFAGCTGLTSVTITGDDMTKSENVKQMMISAGVSSSIEWHMGS